MCWRPPRSLPDWPRRGSPARYRAPTHRGETVRNAARRTQREVAGCALHGLNCLDGSRRGAEGVHRLLGGQCRLLRGHDRRCRGSGRCARCPARAAPAQAKGIGRRSMDQQRQGTDGCKQSLPRHRRRPCCRCRRRMDENARGLVTMRGSQWQGRAEARPLGMRFGGNGRPLFLLEMQWLTFASIEMTYERRPN